MQQVKQNYNDIFAINQSSIKDWREITPNEWYIKWVLREGKRKRGAALEFGNLLDTLCFSESKYDELFFDSKITKPSSNIIDIVTAAYNHIIELNENIEELNKEMEHKVPLKPITIMDNKDIIAKFSEEQKYYEGKPDTAYNRILKEGSAYFESLKLIGDRIVIDPDQKKLAEELKNILFTHKCSKGFFVPKKGCEVIFQEEIFTEVELSGNKKFDVFPIKGKPDIIHINHKLKCIREVDGKYTHDAFRFARKGGPMWLLDYPLQHSFYDNLLREWIKIYDGGKLKDYTIMPPLNVVICDRYKTPYVYQYDFNDLHIKQHGIDGTDIRGWMHEIHDICTHFAINDWSYPLEHLNNGFIKINLFKRR